MTPVSEEVSPLEERLKKAVRSHQRATERVAATRAELHESIKALAATGKKPKEITRMMGDTYDVNHVSRIIRGVTNTRAKKTG